MRRPSPHNNLPSPKRSPGFAQAGQRATPPEAGTAGLAAVGSWAAAFVAAIALVMPALVWMIRPRQGDA